MFLINKIDKCKISSCGWLKLPIAYDNTKSVPNAKLLVSIL
jgi:hypothetical protein